MPLALSPHSNAAPANADHALVLGASGAAGAALAHRLALMGMRVTLAGRSAVAPRVPAYPALARLPWRQVDALRPGALRSAARDCGVIVHAANPRSGVTVAGLRSMPISGAVRVVG